MKNQLGDLIRAERQKRGWTQYDLAEKIDRTVGTIRRQESHSPGAYQPLGPKSLSKVCRVFGWDFVSMLQQKWPNLPLREAPGVYGTHHDDMISDAQRQGLIPKKANPDAIEAIRSMGSRDGAEFQNAEAAAKAYKEAVARPEIRLLEAFSRLPEEAQRRYVKMMEIEGGGLEEEKRRKKR